MARPALRIAVGGGGGGAAADANSSYRVSCDDSGEQIYETKEFVIGPGLTVKESADGQAATTTKLTDFSILGELGAGASSKVYKALHVPTQQVFALKCMDITAQVNRHQLVTELKVLLNCAHTHVVSLKEAFFSQHKIYVVLEFMDRGSIEAVMTQASMLHCTMPEDVIALITAQSLLALCHLHESRRCVHRDLKPGNIFVTRDGLVKLGDFGVAAVQQFDRTDRNQHTFVGTAKYMSPERVQGQPYSFEADIWALGVIALEAFLGRFPWTVSSGFFDFFNQIVNGPVPLPEPGTCSKDFADFIAGTLAKDPAQRLSARKAYMHPFVQNHLPMGARAIKGWLTSIESP